MKMTEFTGYNGEPIYIDTDKIMSVARASDEMTVITMQAGTQGEDWNVKMPLREVLQRIQPT